jgi:hypothetical protein
MRFSATKSVKCTLATIQNYLDIYIVIKNPIPDRKIRTLFELTESFNPYENRIEICIHVNLTVHQPY